MTAPSSTRIAISNPTPSPLPESLRSQINTHLLATNALSTLHSTLLHECQATGWLEDVRRRALELLRSGECGSYGEVMGVIYKEIKGEEGGKDNRYGMNGNAVNGNGREEGKVKTDVRVPERVIKEGVRIVRGVLEEVVDIEVE